MLIAGSNPAGPTKGVIMLICAECLEKKELKKTSFQIFYETCQECGKRITTCYFISEKDEDKKGH